MYLPIIQGRGSQRQVRGPGGGHGLEERHHGRRGGFQLQGDLQPLRHPQSQRPVLSQSRSPDLSSKSGCPQLKNSGGQHYEKMGRHQL